MCKKNGKTPIKLSAPEQISDTLRAKSKMMLKCTTENHHDDDPHKDFHMVSFSLTVIWRKVSGMK